ncbi:MAG TPA: Appr-1-p processing protein [Chromatiales bacterium]|nr:Appr-1-p processing protein [Thiotrichales bacterium]HIP69294.1 Appr-1-p processing protein [Chromatiales bacterium]
MIYEVEGDILLTDAQVIAHGVAAMDPMTQGLAKALHERFPAMHKDFHHWCHQQHPKPGEAWLWGGTNGVRIVNLITQEGGYGHGARPGKATAAHVNHALRALKKMAKKEKFTSIALPLLATGVGGLGWNEVKPLIQQQLGDLDIPVIIYSAYHPQQKADESIAL